MCISVRLVMTASLAAMTAATVVFAPPAPESHPTATTSVPTIRVVSQPLHLTASVQPLAAPTALPGLLVDWLQKVVVPPSANASFPTPQFPPVVAPTSIGSSIKWIYNAVEPWVEWGFDVAAYAVGWIPYVGWLAPQISIFYDFGEMIVRSITFNVADWLDGQINFGQGLVNVGVDTVNAFIFLANAQLAFWLPPLPPIPPIPPIFLPFSAVQATAELTGPESMATMATELPGEEAPAEETLKAAALDPQGDVVEGEGSVVATEVVDATATAAPATAEQTAQTVEATGTGETPAADDVQVRQVASTTSSSGTVHAQGEVRSGTQTTSHATTPAAEPVADEPSESGTGDVTDTTAAETDKTEAPEKVSAGASDDKAKDEKPAKSD